MVCLKKHSNLHHQRAQGGCCLCPLVAGTARALKPSLAELLFCLLETPINTEMCPLPWSVHGQLVIIPNVFAMTQLMGGMQPRGTWSRRR